jgi:hypothetical protein
MCDYLTRGHKKGIQNSDYWFSLGLEDAKILYRPGSQDVTWMELTRGGHNNGNHRCCMKFHAQLKVMSNESVTTVTTAHLACIMGHCVTKLMNVNGVSQTDGLVLFTHSTVCAQLTTLICRRDVTLFSSSAWQSPWRRTLLEKSPVNQLLKTFPTPYRVRLWSLARIR